jgi:hypothetical protein
LILGLYFGIDLVFWFSILRNIENISKNNSFQTSNFLHSTPLKALVCNLKMLPPNQLALLYPFFKRHESDLFRLKNFSKEPLADYSQPIPCTLYLILRPWTVLPMGTKENILRSRPHSCRDCLHQWCQVPHHRKLNISCQSVNNISFHRFPD